VRKILPFLFIASKERESIGVNIEVNLVIDSDLANWEDNFVVVDDA